jgi:hypothetical protein
VAAQTPGDFVVAADDAKSRWSVAIGCGAMTVGCAALVIWGGLVGLVVGLVGLVFFGAMCLPYIVLRAVRPQPPLVVGPDGFTTRQYALDAGFVAWAEVQSIEAGASGPLTWVLVTLGDPQSFVRRHRPVRRFLLRLNSGLRHGRIRIPGVQLPLSAGELARLMEARRNGSS